MSEPVRIHISEIVFNNGNRLPINNNDIVLFIGPNNVGKSQALVDIYSLCKEKSQTVVVSGIKLEKSGDSLRLALDSVSTRQDNGSGSNYFLFGHKVMYYGFNERDFFQSETLGSFRDFFVTKLNTEARLGICQPAESIVRSENKKNPIHYAAFDSKYSKWLSDNYRKAFNTALTANILNGSSIPLCIGDTIKLENDYDDERERQFAYADILSNYKQVQDQGDGIKSFTGILLYLMLDYNFIYLIDEPESFLHPPQARIMGQIIGTSLRENQQAFISTHSEELLKGLIDVCQARLKIIRITREGDHNSFSILDNSNISNVFGDPLLKYSNIMSSLFHKSVVLCESDSDCKMYSVIDNQLKQEKNIYSETLFIHCGGKDRMAKTVSALRTLEVNVKVIPDIDVLNNQTTFRELVEACGIEWGKVEKDYHILISHIDCKKEKVKREKARIDFNRVFDSDSTPDLSEDELKELRKIITPQSKWKAIKEAGIYAIPSGDATAAYNRIDKLLRENGIFLVPVGELEGFIKSIGKHGPEWVNKVLETYPDLTGEEYSQIRKFIESLNL